MQNVCSTGFVELIMHIIDNDVTRGLSQMEILAEEGSTDQYSVQNREMIVNLDVENVYTKTHNQRKTLRKIFKKRKNNNLLKIKTTLNAER